MGFSTVRKHCFSLVELVVVIVIIGIIAAMAIPRLSRGSTGAADAALRGNLNLMRAAIQRYAAEHGGAFPGYHKADGTMNGDGDDDDFLEQLTECSQANGRTGTCGPPRVFGPYLYEIPLLNVGLNADRKPDEVSISTDTPLETSEPNQKGWIYNPLTGEIIANTTAVDAAGVAYKDY